MLYAYIVLGLDRLGSRMSNMTVVEYGLLFVLNGYCFIIEQSTADIPPLETRRLHS